MGMGSEQGDLAAQTDGGSKTAESGIVAAVNEIWDELSICNGPKTKTDWAVGISTAGIAFAACGVKELYRQGQIQYDNLWKEKEKP